MDEAELKVRHGAEFRRCLIALDVVAMRALWAHVAPHLACSSDKEVLVTLHMARAGAESVPVRLRQYSDRWLRERGIGSLLPEHLRPVGWRVRG